MSRDEQIREAAKHHLGFHGDSQFVKGAKWADENNSRQSDINDLCIKFAKEQSRANKLQHVIKLYEDALEKLSSQAYVKFLPGCACPRTADNTLAKGRKIMEGK